MTITKRQAEQRRKSIGSSDAGVILGLDQRRTLYDLWLEKTGRTDGFEGNAVTERGNYLEDGILRWFSDTLGEKVVKGRGSFTCGVLRCHVDGMVGKYAKGQPIVEAKNMVVDDHWGEMGTDQVPPPVMAQVQHQMMCAESDTAYVARLSGGMGMAFSYYTVRADPELQRAIMEQSEAFWTAFVETDTPPPYQAVSENMISYMQRIARNGTEVVKMPDEHLKAYREWKARENEAKDMQRYHRMKVLEMLGTSAEGVSDGYKVKIINATRKGSVDASMLKRTYPEAYEACLTEGADYSYPLISKRKQK